ncbi:MAG: hypothetical protein V2B19_29270 [Pseudomonadota bacterium]
MNEALPHDKLADEIRQIYRSNPTQAAAAIEAIVAERLALLSENEKEPFLTSLASRFDRLGTPPADATPQAGTEEVVFNGIFSLLLGREVSNENLSGPELMERLSEALNTIFGTLNRLVQNINATLLGGNPAEETIRHVIGHKLEGQEPRVSLEEYLGRIDKAFFVSHQGFKQAAHTLVLKMLREIDPGKIAAEAGQGLKFGPLKKAEYFGIYETKFSTLKKWFESGRFMEDLLREFESNCHLNH